MHSLSEPPVAKPPQIILPDVPALAVSATQAAILTTDGEVKLLPQAQAQMAIHRQPVLVCHAPYCGKRLKTEFIGIDVLELFAFVHPGRFCVPTPVGLARALGLSVPDAFEDYPLTLVEAAQALLEDLSAEPRTGKKMDPVEVARVMGLQGKGWAWTPFVLSAFGEEYQPDMPIMTRTALNVWKHLPEWSEDAPPPPPRHNPVSEEESRERLGAMLGAGAEARTQQADYASRMTAAFLPAQTAEEPHLVLAEAGTGVGKTLGYLSPASVWAEKNEGSVWISTYTKNLQRQIDQELDRLHPDPELKTAKVAIRKGRENYLCLLNLEDEVMGAALAKHAGQAIAAGIMARWAGASRDGDLSGGDFPGWLPGLLGFKHTLMLADRRGECIYAACDHYHKCFVERAIRRSKHAQLVVANHALVMIQTALAGHSDALPQRYVFDEGHHLFEAADSAFAGHLTARETADLRRWIRGAEEGARKSRARGLKRRVEDLIEGDGDSQADLEAILHHATALPAFGWARRLKDGNPQGAVEAFTALVYQQVFARAAGRDGPYSLETDTRPLIDGLDEAAVALKQKLRALQKPMRALTERLRKRLEEQAETLDGDTRRRIESVTASIERRADMTLAAWISMLDTLAQPESPEQYVDWMEIERVDGQAVDVGLYRHWVDPMRPFAAALKPHAHGVAITSATLRDGTGDADEDWRVARERTGADYLTAQATQAAQFSVPSPFNYADQTRIFIINDVRKDDLGQVAAAYRTLFEAAGGGGLGLFTAIQRLRAVHERIGGLLEEAGIPVYAQHIDEIDTGTLVDIFREDRHACLLGTDAVRDGVDVPGDSLRLLIYDRVPWPRPTILHRARRGAFGGRRYDELLTRLKLRQAYGRLVRREADRGIFVMMDSMLPSRLHSAFPDGVPIIKTGLAEAAAEIRDFLVT